MTQAAGAGGWQNQPDKRMLRVAAICGLTGQVGFTALWIIWGFIEKNYEVMRQDISDFGALDATHPLPYNILLSAAGVLTVLFAYGLYQALRPGVAALAGSATTAVFGIGQILDGLLREDCSPSGNAACRAAADAGTLSWHHTAHDLESFVTIASVIGAPLVLSFAFRNRDGWRDLVTYGRLTAAATLVLVVVYGVSFAANDGSSVNGLVQRGAVTVAVLFPAILSLRLWRLARISEGPLRE